MKIMSIILLVIGLTVNCFALTATETKKVTTTEITITFTQDEYDLFSLDKGDPKEWVKNACDVNMADHTRRIKEELTKGIVPSEIDFKAKVKALQVEKLEKEKEIR